MRLVVRAVELNSSATQSDDGWQRKRGYRDGVKEDKETGGKIYAQNDGHHHTKTEKKKHKKQKTNTEMWPCLGC